MLNTYLIADCDTGGGKSNVYNRVIAPVIEFIDAKTMKKLALETYTTARIKNKSSREQGVWSVDQ